MVLLEIYIQDLYINRTHTTEYLSGSTSIHPADHADAVAMEVISCVHSRCGDEGRPFHPIYHDELARIMDGMVGMRPWFKIYQFCKAQNLFHF